MNGTGDILKEADPIVEFSDVSFAYDGATVLSGVSFSIHDGEFIAITGANGSGKSTIAQMIDAFLLPDSGSVRVFGHETSRISNGNDAFDLRSNIGFVFQNPDDQLVASIVADEVAFGPANLGVAREDLIARIDFALDAVDMSWAVGRDVNSLSGGERQRIAIAGALAMHPRLLILDEPTSMLDGHNRQKVMEIIGKAHGLGTAIILITHEGSEAMQADKVFEVDGGRVIERQREQYRDSVSADLENHEKAVLDLRRTTPHAQGGKPIISVSNCSFTYDSDSMRSLNIFGNDDSNAPAPPVLTNINLEVHQGEFLCITGSNGAGKTTLIQLLNGMLKPTSGTVEVNGVPTATKSGANHARRTVGIVFQYPERALFSDTVADDIAYGPKNQGLSPDTIDRRVRDAMMDVGLDYGRFAECSPFELSGGEQRKVAIAGILAMHPDVIVFDEPCAGLDRGSHMQLVGLLAGMRDAGQTIIMISHDKLDIRALADKTFNLKKTAS